MSNIIRRTIGLVLVLAMIASFALVPGLIETKAEAASVPSSLATYVQDGATLQCWNWSVENIKANLGLIANMGYSAVQVSPMQVLKEGTVNKPVNNWWAVYQPIAFEINTSNSHAIGTRDELIELCAEAHKYDIKVIMDVVFNHTANDGDNKLCPLVDPDFLNDPACWHDYSQNASHYNDRYDVTQRCMAGLPDLNTGNQKVQDKALALMKDYIDCGVDGFRFDAAKQIETPDDDSSYASDFWPTVVNGASDYAAETRNTMLYFYGELLQETDNYGSLPITAYTKYMSATESVWSNDVRYKLEDHSAAALQMSYFKQCNADKLVLWAESHDTIGDGTSVSSSQYTIDKAWALVASRAYTMALYFPRTNAMGNIATDERIPQEMGELAKTGWSSAFTKAVNGFHNHFIGQSEWLTQDSGANLYYNERGNSGIMIVNFNDGARDINLPVYAMASGTYYDQLTGNKFTVSGGRIYGSMGDSGVAVVYNPTSVSCSHASHGTDGYCYDCYAYVGHESGSTCSVCGVAATRTIYFKNTSNWSTPYIYAWHETAGEATASWPGNKMTKVEGNLYSAEVPATATNIIFNNNNGTQTANLVPSATDDTYDYETSFWSTQGEVVTADNYYIFYTTNSDAYNGYDYRFVDGKVTVPFTETSYVWVIDSNGVQYMTDGWAGAVNSVTLKTLENISNGADKLGVPGSTVTFTMVPNADGTITLSYELGGNASGGNEGGDIGGGDEGDDPTFATKTIYFDNASSNWSKVNAYAWSDDGTWTHEWPGTAMTSVGDNIYSIEIPVEATLIIFNDGTSQTKDLTIPTDGKNLFNGTAWSIYTPDDIGGGDEGGDVGGDDDTTGGNVPDNLYYLFWDTHNAWDIPFVDGKVTYTFDETTYLWVISKDGGIQYMTDGWQGNVNSVKLYPQPDLTTPDKLAVPAGTHTLTLNDNGDGSLTLSYGEASGGNQGGGNEGGDVGGDDEVTTDTISIYFQNNWMWSDVSLHYWGSKAGDTTWPGKAMELYGNDGTYDIYKLDVPADITGIVITGIKDDGTNTLDQTPDITSGWYDGICYYMAWNDGNTTGSEKIDVILPNECDHSYSEKVTTDATCDKDGVKTFTCSKCGDTYTEAIPATGHNYVDGICTVCGAEQTKDTMTIYFQNNWLWSDVCLYYWGSKTAGADWPGAKMEKYGNDGIYDIYALEIPSDVTGIVINGIKDDGSGERDKTPDITSGWYDGICYYMTWNDGNATGSEDINVILPTECDHSYTSKVTKEPTCTATGTKTYTCSKCGDSYTESIAANGHSYVNGVCSVCGAKDPDYVEVVAPTITLKTPTLLLEDTIKLNIYYTIDQDIALDKMGMLTWSSKPDVVDIATAENVYPGATFNDGNGFYGVNTDGIPAQNLGDTIYFCIYAELADGSIAYGKQVQYSPVTYAYNQLKGGATAEMKALLVAILNYGAAAQTYLEDTDPLVNANLTDDMKALVEAYRSDMVHSVAMPSASKQGAMAANGGFSAKKPSISLDGAFSINYYFTPSATVTGNMTFYYWNAEDFANASVLSASNATGSAVMTNNNGEYSAAIEGIAAKDVDGALYACGVYTDANGNTYSTGILPYSLGFYCGNQAKGTGALADLAAAIAVYGYYAAAYFAQ